MAYFKKLKADLAAAASGGIITPEQADKVWQDAYARRPMAGFKAVHFIAAAAGLFIALGFILVAAHNWDKLGAMLKMGVFLLLLAGVAEAALRLDEKPAAAIPLETLWFFMPILGIGLYAQIFNLSGDPVKPYLAWAALSAPLALLSRRPLAASLNSILLFTVLFWGTLNQASLLSLTSGYGRPPQPLWHWAAALAVLAAGAALYPGRKTGLPLGAACVWTFIMLAADTALKTGSGTLLLMAGMSLSVLWLAWGGPADELRTGLPLKIWLGSVYMMTFFWHHTAGARELFHGATWAGAVAAWVLFAGALLTIALRGQRLLPGGKQADMISKLLLAVSVLSSFLLFGADDVQLKVLAALANFILIAYGAACIVGGSENADEKAINRGVLVITLTAITRFVDLFGGLLASGEAFIVTGLAFAALAYFINKGRKALIEAAKK